MKSALITLSLLFDYALHTLMTVGGFAILVGATVLIHKCAATLEEQFYKIICHYLEEGLFVLGVLLFVIITLSLTFIFGLDLVKTFRSRNEIP